LVNTSTATIDGKCSALWQKNLGPDLDSGEPLFGETRSIPLPRLKWNGLPASDSSPPPPKGGDVASKTRNENCSLAGQVTAFWNSFGSPWCHDGTPNGSECRPASNPEDPTLYCDPNGRECPATLTDPEPFTYLYYRWV